MEEAKELDIYIRHEYEVVAPLLADKLYSGGDLSEVAGIAYRRDGEVKINGDAAPIKNYNDIPVPAYDLIHSFDNYYENTKHGQPFTIMYTSKGCPYSCIYCTVANTKWRARSAESVLEELRYLKQNHNIKTVTFFDETFTIDRKRVKKICQAMIDEELDIRWYCNSRVDLIDRELLEDMRRAGCRAVCMGIESGSQKVIGGTDKRASVERAALAIRMVKDVGIKAYCSFVLGLPGENHDTVRETIEFVKRTLPTGAQFNVAVPYPGTKLYDIALEKGWIAEQTDFRNMYQHKSLMRTEELTGEDLDAARKKAYAAIYLNYRWWLQNLFHVVKHPEDFEIASRYVSKILSNYFLHRMAHSH